jgi:SAM-dependent methyltransferase
VDNEDYFGNIRGDYRRAVDGSAEGYANIAAELAGLLHGRVVDFGNGGVIHYATERIERLTCVDIINDATPVSRGKVEFVKGDFYAYDFPADTDCVLVQFLLHHLPDDARLAAALAALCRTLGTRGRLVVVEALMPRPMEALQNALQPATSRLLRALHKPPLRFFSRRSLAHLLTDAGFAELRFRRVGVGARMAPAGALFPRLFIPGWMYPMQWVVVEATPPTVSAGAGTRPHP